MIHHFALLLFKNYLTIQVGMLQRIHHQYNRYKSSLDNTLIGIMHDPSSRNCAIFVCYVNSSELLPQSVALRSQYSDHAPEAVTLH